MTSRERVLRALDHREPDRVPLGIWSTVDAYRKLRKYLGMTTREEYPVGALTMHRDVSEEEDLIEKLGLDVIRMCVRPPGGLRRTADGSLVDEWGCGMKVVEHPTGYYLEILDPPLKDATVDDLRDYPWPNPFDPAAIDGLEERARFLRKNTEYAIALQCGRGGILGQAERLRGFDTTLLDLAIKPDFVSALFEKLTEIEIGFNRVGIDAVGQYVDILRMSPSDFGSAESTLFSPKMYERMIGPFYQRALSFAKKEFRERNPNGKVQFHSCGAIRPLMDGWIHAGMDVFDPLQPRVAEGSRPADLKGAYGDRISFWGGIDVQVTLPQGTRDDVIAEVGQRIREMGPGGGYILSSSHRLQPDIPCENIVAMYDAAKEFGVYPIKR